MKIIYQYDPRAPKLKNTGVLFERQPEAMVENRPSSISLYQINLLNLFFKLIKIILLGTLSLLNTIGKIVVYTFIYTAKALIYVGKLPLHSARLVMPVLNNTPKVFQVMTAIVKYNTKGITLAFTLPLILIKGLVSVLKSVKTKLFDIDITIQKHVLKQPVTTKKAAKPALAYTKPARSTSREYATRKKIGFALLAISMGGISGPLYPYATMGVNVAKKQAGLVPQTESHIQAGKVELPDFDPLLKDNGERIVPNNTDFAVIVPKIGINANIIPGVNPASKEAYFDALDNGVAHSSSSFYPNQDGTTYLFSHSTNYEWFVDDLNAVFWKLDSLEDGDLVVVIYNNIQYTYKMTGKKIVSPKDIRYLIPQTESKNLILQTCYPPGTRIKRQLNFAQLIDERPYEAPAS